MRWTNGIFTSVEGLDDFGQPRGDTLRWTQPHYGLGQRQGPPHDAQLHYFTPTYVDNTRCPMGRRVAVIDHCPTPHHVTAVMPICEGTAYHVMPYGSCWPIDIDRAKAHEHPGCIQVGVTHGP